MFETSESSKDHKYKPTLGLLRASLKPILFIKTRLFRMDPMTSGQDNIKYQKHSITRNITNRRYKWPVLNSKKRRLEDILIEKFKVLTCREMDYYQGFLSY